MKRVIWLLALAACAGESAAPTRKARPDVYVVNYPLQYFAERIGGDAVDVRFPAPAGGDPAFWKPSNEDVAGYQQAELILLNGAGYAGWAGKVSLPDARCVTTFSGAAIKLEKTTHTHGPEGEHDHRGHAFTTWLDFSEAVRQAGAVRDALVRLAPQHKDSFEKNFAALERDLTALDAELEAAAPKIPLVGSHPVYQYLARRYGLQIRSVHWEPDEVPDEKGWEELGAILKDHPAKLMLWEGEPNKETAARLKKIGFRCIVFDPCGNKPESGDFLTVMRRNAEHLGRVKR